jgi:Carboxypeptidase regulatory-like domain
MLTLVATAMLVLAFSSAAAAQTGAVLSGAVHDQAGEPVSGVVLTIEDPITGDTRVTISDSRGMYSVDRLHYGTQYAVDVSHPRFRESRVWASANEGDTAVDIALVPPRSRFVRVLLFPLRVLSFGVIE